WCLLCSIDVSLIYNNKYVSCSPKFCNTYSSIAKLIYGSVIPLLSINFNLIFSLLLFIYFPFSSCLSVHFPKLTLHKQVILFPKTPIWFRLLSYYDYQNEVNELELLLLHEQLPLCYLLLYSSYVQMRLHPYSHKN